MNFLSQVIEATLNPAAEVVTPAPAPKVSPQQARLDARAADFVMPELFQVRSEPIYYHDTRPTAPTETPVIKGKKALMVGNSCVQVVSEKYEVHQPAEVVEQFKTAVEKNGLTFNACKLNPSKGAMLLSAHFSDLKILGENHAANLVFYTSHCGKYKTFLTLNLLRVVCENQLPTLYNQKSRFIFSEKHYQNALNLKTIGAILEKIPTVIDWWNQRAEVLDCELFSFDKALRLYKEKEKLNAEQKTFNSKMEEFRERYFNAPGQDHLGQTKYKAYQAITHMHTHKVKQTASALETQLITNGNKSLEYLEVLLNA